MVGSDFSTLIDRGEKVKHVGIKKIPKKFIDFSQGGPKVDPEMG